MNWNFKKHNYSLKTLVITGLLIITTWALIEWAPWKFDIKGTITKGLIGKQDLALMYSGDSAETFTRATSTGYTITLNKIDWPGIDVCYVFGGGVTKTSTVVAEAVTAVGTTEKVELYLGRGAWPVTGTLTIPANITIHFAIGAYFSGSGTVAYAGSPDAQIKALEDQQIYSLTLVVTHGRTGTTYPARHGLLTTAAAADNKTSIDAAIASMPAGSKIQLSGGVFAVAPGITPGKRNITIKGVGTSYAYQDNTPGTKLVFTAGTYGFDLTDVAMDHQYCKIMDITIDGNDALTYGIGVQGLHIIEEIMVKNCVTAGIFFEDNVNSTHLNKVTCYSNTGYGLLIAGVSTTVFSVENSTFEANGVGIKQGSGLGYFNSLVIESNTGAGWEIYKIDDSLSLENHMNRIYFEDNNTGTTNYTMSTACEDATEHMILYFTNSNVNQADGGGVKGIDLHGVWYSHFNNVSIGGGDTAHGMDIDTTSIYNLIENYGTGNTIVDGGSGNILVKRKTATTVDSLGGLEYTGVLKATRFDTGSGVTASTASGAAVTLFNAATSGIYFVGVFIPGQGTEVHASVTVVSDGTDVSLKNYETAGAAMAITISGTNVQATQGTGNAQVISYRYIKL